MRNTFNCSTTEPYLYSCDSIITEVNKGFIDFTGFTMDDLLGKSLMEIGNIIRINSQILLDSISGEYSGYIFTKLLEAREVNILLINGKDTSEKVFTFLEKPNSRLDAKLIFVEQAFIDNISGVAIYSTPDLILLKANQTYLDFLDSPFNNEETSIGRTHREIATGFVGNQAEVLWETVIETKKAISIKEHKFDKLVRGTTYWDSNVIPIFENKKMKYIFETTIEVTERFLKNQNIELQNKIIQEQSEQLEKQLEEKNIQLINLLENLSEAVVISDNKGKITMINAEAKRLIYKPEISNALGDTFKNGKAFDMKGNEIPFENLPGIRALRGEKVKNTKMFVRHPDKEYFMEASAIPIYNISGDIAMVISCFHDITETIEQSRKIEEQKNQLEAIIENIADGISIFDKNGHYTLFNKSSREMFFPPYQYMVNTGDGFKQSELFDIDGERIESQNTPVLEL